MLAVFALRSSHLHCTKSLSSSRVSVKDAIFAAAGQFCPMIVLGKWLAIPVNVTKNAKR